MMLDRARLAQYVGHDPEFEAEFLSLLMSTVQTCLAALATPTLQIYSTLHAAKVAIAVSTCEEMRGQIERACDQTVNLLDTGWTDEAHQALAHLMGSMKQLALEIKTVLHA